MKKFEYTVKGLNSSESAETLISALATALPEAKEPECDIENSKLSFSLKNNEISRRDAEMRLSGALAVLGFELILPEGVDNYSFVGDSPKKTRSVPVSVAVSIAAFIMAVTMLFSFVACEIYNPQNNVGVSGPTGNIIIEDEDIPAYIQELIKLDAIFKSNSYDGINEEEMGSAVLKAYVAATGDLYAEYMTAEEYEQYTSESAGEFVGIGVSIVNTTIEINGYNYKVLQIISVFENSPAIENDVKVGDCIMYVGGGSERTMVDLLGYTEALNRMLGEAGTNAEFTILRPDKSEDIGYKEIEFEITRRKVTTESVKYRVSETDSKVGIVNVTGFDQTTAPQFCAAIDALKAKGCEYFVFDMRNNPGGALASIEVVLSYFLDEGDLIVSTEYADGTKEEDRVRPINYGSRYEGYNITRAEIGKYKSLAGKCVVLTNENTASAAELFTATFRDYGIAPIVGQTTYGKGCMQNIIDLQRYYGMPGALRVTTAMYFSASHTVYHGTGIVPDYEVELSDEAKEYNFYLLPEEKDDQLKTAIDLLTK